MTYNTEGIILRYRDIGEFDRIYSILTSDHGKVDAWAQGVRKPQSKLVAHLQPLYLCDLMFARGRRFDRVAQVRVLNRWASVWSDLEKMGQAVYAASLVDMVVRPGVRERGVFELMQSLLEIMSTPSPPPQSSPIEGEEEKGGILPSKMGEEKRISPPLVGGVRGGGVPILFSLKLLKESGFSPELRNCVLCKAVVEGLSRYFDAIRGGVVCGQNHPLIPSLERRGDQPISPPARGGDSGGVGAFPVSSLTIETLEEVLSAPLAFLEMPDLVQSELDIIAKSMIAAHFGEEPRARVFVDALAKEPLYAEGTV